MTTATLEVSTTRLDEIKAEKASYNEKKIAEAEALAAEALRMANEAKLAAARLAEVKKTLSMFSSKLEKAEQSVTKDLTVKSEPVVVMLAPPKEEPAPSPVKSLVSDVEPVAAEPPAPKAAPVAPVATTTAVVPAQRDVVEDFLDGLGVDKMCGLDDETLGLEKRPEEMTKKEVFVNPTRIAVAKLTAEDMLRPTSEKEAEANATRLAMGQPALAYQRTPWNEDFEDPFGVDHDDLVMCGKLADTCEPEPLDFMDEENDIVQ